MVGVVLRFPTFKLKARRTNELYKMPITLDPLPKNVRASFNRHAAAPKVETHGPPAKGSSRIFVFTPSVGAFAGRVYYCDDPESWRSAVGVHLSPVLLGGSIRSFTRPLCWTTTVMATVLQRSRPASFFALPCNVRQQLYQNALQGRPAIARQQQQIRKFSIDSVDSVVSNIVHGPAYLMIGLHNTGLPWWSVIPLSALTIRTCLVLPAQTLRRRAIYRMTLLQPLIDARMSLQRRTQLIRSPHLTWSSQRVLLLIRRQAIRFRVAKTFDARGRITFALVGFAILLLVSENIRQISGRRGGILSLFLGAYFPSLEDSEENGEQRAAGRKAKEAEANRPKNVFGEAVDGGASEPVPEQQGEKSHVTWFQPSLKTGGFSFCPDLTAPDLSLTLPALFSASFMASIYFAPRVAREPAGDKTAQSASGAGANAEPNNQPNKMVRALLDRPGMTNLQKIMMTVALLMVYPAMQMPGALLLYFISNLGVGAIHVRLLSKAMPIRNAPLACRRPVRMNPVRERLDLIAASTSSRKA